MIIKACLLLMQVLKSNPRAVSSSFNQKLAYFTIWQTTMKHLLIEVQTIEIPNRDRFSLDAVQQQVWV